MNISKLFFIFSFLFTSCKVSDEISKIDIPLKNGTHFLESKLGEIDPNLFPLLVWNNERLNLGMKIDTGKWLKKYNDLKNPFLTIYRSNFANEEAFVKQMQTNQLIFSDELMFRSLYCEKIPINDKLYGDITMLSRGTEYELAHSYLFFSMLKNKGCADNWYVDSIQKGSLARIEKSLKEYPEFSDLNTEYTAFMMYANQFGKMDKSFLQKIIDLQKPDGSWVGENVSAYKSYELHTCFLAVWALGEWKREILAKEMGQKKKSK